MPNAGAEPPRSGRFRAPGSPGAERREGAPAQPRRSPSAKRRENAVRMSGGSGGELARRSWSPLDPLVGRSEAEASQRIPDPHGVGTPRSGVPTESLTSGHGF